MTAEDDRRRAWLRRGIVPLDYPEPVAEDWPALLEICRRRGCSRNGVKLVDNGDATSDGKLNGGGSATDSLRHCTAAITGLERVLAITPEWVSRRSSTASSCLVRMVYSHKRLIVFPVLRVRCLLHCFSPGFAPRYGRAFLGILTGRIGFRYTPSDCFETFPFPAAWDTCADLETAGETCYAFRAELMARSVEGLTQTYNRFRDPYEDGPEIIRPPQTCTLPWTAPFSTPTAGPTFRPTASSCSTMQIDEAEIGAPGRSRTVTAGRMKSVTRSWRGCWNLTPKRAAEEVRTGKSPRGRRWRSRADRRADRSGASPAPHGRRNRASAVGDSR